MLIPVFDRETGADVPRVRRRARTREKNQLKKSSREDSNRIHLAAPDARIDITHKTP
jgi:hypothetical protein